jgi:polyhydroxybutyrate depolymerase
MGKTMVLRGIAAALLCGAMLPAIYAQDTETGPLKPGGYPLTLNHDGRERTYLLYVPPQYDGTKALPLVFFFHGGVGTAKHAAETYGWNELADKEGFLVAYPNGTGSFQTWNAIHGCGAAFRGKIDDVGFVRALVGELNGKLNVDPKRIFATGMSNGAMLTYRLAAEMSDVFAAVAPVAGSIGGKENSGAGEKRIPRPANPVPIVIFHGKADHNVTYAGGQSHGVERNRIDLSVADAVAFWVKANGCAANTVSTKMAGGDVIHDAYASANGADVELYTIVSGGHAWPGAKRSFLKGAAGPSRSISATDIAWEFFKAHPKK